MTRIWPISRESNSLIRHNDPTVRRIRWWYAEINRRLGRPLPSVAFIGWLPRRMEGKFGGLSCWLEFPDETRAVMIMVNRKMAFNPNIWMATLTHEITHLLRPNEDCGTVKHEDAVIELRRKVLNIKRWRLL